MTTCRSPASAAISNAAAGDEYFNPLSISCRRANIISSQSTVIRGSLSLTRTARLRPSSRRPKYSRTRSSRACTCAGRFSSRTLPASISAIRAASVTSRLKRSVSSSMIAISSLSGAGKVWPSARIDVDAALIDVSGVLNSCAMASSSVDLNSSLCRATSARVAASCARTRSSAIATRFNSACSAPSGNSIRRAARLPIGCPPSVTGATLNPDSDSYRLVPCSTTCLSFVSMSVRSSGPPRYNSPPAASYSATASHSKIWAIDCATCRHNGRLASLSRIARLNAYSCSVSRCRWRASSACFFARSDKWLATNAVARNASSATQF